MDDLPPIRRIIPGRNIHFQILGRASVATVQPDLSHILISITDPDVPTAEFAESENRVAFLRLQFDDADREGYRLLTPEEAEAIVAFVEQHRDRAALIVCQCEAGMSRSAGVAAALSRWLNEDDHWFFDRFHPNRHVYRTVLNAAMARRSMAEAEEKSSDSE
jgi:predicted protein tyrosine phosphatase